MNTIPYRGIEVFLVVPAAAAAAGATPAQYRWRCFACKRMGRIQSREKAIASAQRHREYHTATDKPKEHTPV